MWQNILFKVVAALAVAVSLMAFYAANPVAASVASSSSSATSPMLFIVSMVGVIVGGAILVYALSKKMK